MQRAVRLEDLQQKIIIIMNFFAGLSTGHDFLIHLKMKQWNIHSKILPANIQPKRKKHSKSDTGLSKVIPLIIILILTVCTHNVPVQYTITIFLGDNSQINSLCISAGNQGNLYNVKKEYNKHRYQTHRKMWAHNLHHWNNFFLIRSNIQCTIIYCRR